MRIPFHGGSPGTENVELMSVSFLEVVPDSRPFRMPFEEFSRPMLRVSM